MENTGWSYYCVHLHMVCSVPCSTSFRIPGKKRDQRDALKKKTVAYGSVWKWPNGVCCWDPKKLKFWRGSLAPDFSTLFAAYTLNRNPWGFWVWSQVSSKNLTHSNMRETEVEMCLGRLHLATLWNLPPAQLVAQQCCQNIRRTPSYLVRLWMVLSGTGILSWLSQYY